LDGQPFDYLAKPSALLKGYLVVGGALIVMNISNRISPLTGYIISAVAWSLVPFLLYKAHRFKAKNSAYRNIRFHFSGTPTGAYKAYGFIPLAILLSLVVALPVLLIGQDNIEVGAVSSMVVGGIAILSGLLLAASFPYFAFLQRRYLHDNFSYGKTASAFSGAGRRFYGIYVKASLMMLGVGIGGGLLTAIAMPLLIGLRGEGGGPMTLTLAFGIGLIFYAIFGMMFLLVQQYIYATTFNYSWDNTRIGSISFKISLEAKGLAWIRLTNVLAIVLSLGFLVPWAKIRRARYILPRTTVILPGDMDVFEAAKDYTDGAAGDTAADFFDWDIGW